MDSKTKQKIEEIRKRLEEYFKETRDPHRTATDILNANFKFLAHGPEDVEFLLNELDKTTTIEFLLSELEKIIKQIRDDKAAIEIKMNPK